VMSSLGPTQRKDLSDAQVKAQAQVEADAQTHAEAHQSQGQLTLHGRGAGACVVHPSQKKKGGGRTVAY